MNKYLKMLMLSGGLVGAIAPTAIDLDKTENNDLGAIYEQVEKMQDALPRLSRIKYKLNIDVNDDTTSDISDSNDNETTDDTDKEDNLSNSNNDITDDHTISDNSSNTKNNVTFTTTDDDGNETNLTNQETITYLNETLEQTNNEYEQLKTTLSNAIKDTMDYLDAYKNGKQELTNEQKIYIKEQSNSIKFLAETLEDLSEEVICCIDGCATCDDNDDSFEQTTSKYLATIADLEIRIDALNNAIASLQFINNIGNPFFFNPAQNHYIYGYHYNSQNNNSHQDDENNLENGDENNADSNLNINTNENEIIEVENEQQEISDYDEQTNNSVTSNEYTQDNVEHSNQDENLNNDTSLSVNNETDKPTTFGLKSNIDTYAPTKRNIDTFFNTALYNNEYMNGNGYGYGYRMPYGYGGGYGYGMPYGNGYYGNPYGMELNSNLINREVIEKQQEKTTSNPIANIDSEINKDTELKKSQKHNIKRAKNIDTYTEITVKSNVNTMGESKISRFFKEKFNNLRKKVKKQKNEVQENQNSQEVLQNNTPALDQLLENNEVVTNNDNLNIDNNQNDSKLDKTPTSNTNLNLETQKENVNDVDESFKDMLNDVDDTQNLNIDNQKLNIDDTFNNAPTPKQEKDIKTTH